MNVSDTYERQYDTRISPASLDLEGYKLVCAIARPKPDHTPILSPIGPVVPDKSLFCNLIKQVLRNFSQSAIYQAFLYRSG